jgi:hypothetical protein
VNDDLSDSVQEQILLLRIGFVNQCEDSLEEEIRITEGNIAKQTEEAGARRLSNS